MAENLDVLVLESHPRVADDATRALEAAGHRVHRCHGPDSRGFPCVGVSDHATCPIQKVDVALLVRRSVSALASPLEDGASCAIRAGVPLVEEGSDLLDPFAPWVAERSQGDVVGACERAAERRFDPLRHDIANRISTLLESGGLEVSDVACRIETDGPRIRVTLEGPEVGRHLEQALGVRVLDAIRASDRTFGEVNVSYQARPEKPAPPQ